MNARTAIYKAARQPQSTSWTLTWISPSRANVSFERGIERIEIEFSRADTVVWAARYRNDTLDYPLQPYTRNKRQIVLDWLAEPARLQVASTL